MLSFPSWSSSAAALVAVAAGRQAADLVIRRGRLVNVQSREVLEGWEVAVVQGRFAYVGPDAGHCIGPDTELVDAEGQFLIPGLSDAHMHIESGMLTPAEFAAAVTPHGTTTMFTDPHEIANVLGLDGVRMMHDEAMKQPINIFTQMPSCAPSAPGLETTGFEIGPEDVAEAMTWPGIIGLGEMMNYPGVINGDPQMLAEMAATMDAGKTVGGHYASPDRGIPFLLTQPAAPRTTMKAPPRLTRLRVCAKACGLCCALDRRGMTLKAKLRLSPKRVSTPETSCSAPMIVIRGHWSMKAT